MFSDHLIGREREQAEIRRALAEAAEGRGSLLLVAGEAGVGKTRLVDEVLTEAGVRVLSGIGTQNGAPYEPVVSALRSYLKSDPDGFAGSDPLLKQLALIMPELGPPPERSDRASLYEALHSALALVARPAAAVFLDDLHLADAGTLEFLAGLSAWIERERLLVIGAYRNDELPRTHALRRLRADLRRARRLREVALEPLTGADTALLMAEVLKHAPSPEQVSVCFEKTRGLPFFVEELTAALAETTVTVEGVPLPDSVKDAVLLRIAGLSDGARSALEVAAVLGEHFELELLASMLGTERGIEEALDAGFVIEEARGRAVFRHALSRDVVYGSTIWTRRRSLHRQAAALLVARGAPASELVGHQLAGGMHDEARRSLIAAAEAACSVHAYRDAARMARMALDVWQDGEDAPGRLAVLDRLGQCLELSGELPGAARVWTQVAEGRAREGDQRLFAETQRRLASVFELQGDSERAVGARQAAAEAFRLHGLPGEAAAETLIAARHLSSVWSAPAVLELATTAAEEARQANRPDLLAQAMGLTGRMQTALGELDSGLDTIREAVTLALSENLTATAAELYYELATALDEASDYPSARQVYRTAIAFCQARDVNTMAHLCLACLAVVLIQTGEWDEAIEICRSVLTAPETDPAASAIARGMLGTIQALRGQKRSTRRLLTGANAFAREHGIASLDFYTTWGLALLEELNGNIDAAADRCRRIRDGWEEAGERHYVVPALRWSATFFARQSLASDANACSSSLAAISSSTGNEEAMSALAHALGECALLEGDARGASDHFEQALDSMRRLEVPFWRAHTMVRAAVARSAMGEREAAAEQLVSAYRTSRKLHARPLMSLAARELSVLGEPLVGRLGKRAAEEIERGGLSRREFEVLRLLVAGHTSPQIAERLFLSPRTVEMHVGNILLKLDCSSRTQAATRARELRLID